MTHPVSMSDLNTCPMEDFVRVCGPFFEHSPWIARRTWDRRPFPSRQALHEAFVETIERAA
ncbi:MAG TPA: 2-oxo-4-hydroxy-4-carboxy-5-ureidoimidazoline decarboxylase, partial [Pirellulaceae bacterium]